ncbi:hypothetical protein ZIOFF_024546 [Zingiber officinale]|uniref:Nucleotide-diphospho-sugar transferase domain-containing protein n=1 Tax=Zingiber officinale TaxID=94328 RepID=A0A8J5LG93_ZINOF|nr:hypothetical protein ZIOFF_024546 [Zingiber officinale]
MHLLHFLVAAEARESIPPTSEQTPPHYPPPPDHHRRRQKGSTRSWRRRRGGVVSVGPLQRDQSPTTYRSSTHLSLSLSLRLSIYTPHAPLLQIVACGRSRCGLSSSLSVPGPRFRCSSGRLASSLSLFVELYICLQEKNDVKLEKVLKEAAMENKTVILTTLNAAWASPGSIIDLFFQSFRTGDGTRRLLDHLVIIALDKKAYIRCISLHTHCFALYTEGMDFSDEKIYMTAGYLSMMWRRIEFLRVILEMGYNFIFSFTNLKYSRVEIDEVRFEWAECMLDYI